MQTKNTFNNCEIDQFHTGQGNNIKICDNKKSLFDYIYSWYGAIIAGTASILGFWAFAWKEWSIWFFGL